MIASILQRPSAAPCRLTGRWQLPSPTELVGRSQNNVLFKGHHATPIKSGFALSSSSPSIGQSVTHRIQPGSEAAIVESDLAGAGAKACHGSLADSTFPMAVRRVLVRSTASMKLFVLGGFPAGTPYRGSDAGMPHRPVRRPPHTASQRGGNSRVRLSWWVEARTMWFSGDTCHSNQISGGPCRRLPSRQA